MTCYFSISCCPSWMESAYVNASAIDEVISCPFHPFSWLHQQLQHSSADRSRDFYWLVGQRFDLVPWLSRQRLIAGESRVRSLALFAWRFRHLSELIPQTEPLGSLLETHHRNSKKVALELRELSYWLYQALRRCFI